VRKEKPRVSAFISADLPKILALEPDLVLAFSDLQADIVRDLVKAGVAVHAFNQRDVGGILAMVVTVGGLVGAPDKAMSLAAELEGHVAAACARAARLPRRPKVYFEEWDAPMISCIGWVSELIDAAGGIDVFADRARAPDAKGRVVTSEEVVAAAPDVIIGSWCGKKFVPERVTARPGFDAIPAVQSGALHEIKSPLILQPGPAALTEGLAALEAIIHAAARRPASLTAADGTATHAPS
jgi:iron complex transport system substrate-binding protein